MEISLEIRHHNQITKHSLYIFFKLLLFQSDTCRGCPFLKAVVHLELGHNKLYILKLLCVVLFSITVNTLHRQCG